MSNLAWRMTTCLIVTISIGLETRIAQAQAVLSNWRYNSTSEQLEFFLKEQTTPRYFLLSEPTRLVIDLPNTKLGTVATQQIYSGAIQQIRVSQFDDSTTRIVMNFASQVRLSSEQVQLQQVGNSGAGNRWILRPLGGEITTTEAILPPVSFGDSQAVTVRVPSLAGTGATPSPTVPVITPTGTPSPPVQRRPSRSVPPVIEFGQPLPKAK